MGLYGLFHYVDTSQELLSVYLIDLNVHIITCHLLKYPAVKPTA